MKNYLHLCLALCLASGTLAANAQKMEQKDADWYNCSFEEDGVYGAEVNRAYRYLQGKTPRKQPLIAFIGTGMDVMHEDLTDAVWVNSAPTRGDVNGWNFLGGRDEETMTTVPSYADREYARLGDTYGDLVFADGKYWTVKDGRFVEYGGKVDSATYAYYDHLRQVSRSGLMNTRYNCVLAHRLTDFVRRANREMKAMSPGKELRRADYEAWYDADVAHRSRLDSMSFLFTNLNYQIQEQYAAKPIPWDTLFAYYDGGKYIAYCEGKFRDAERFADLTIRKRIIGDDEADLSDDDYGNGNLFSSGCTTEVMRASIAVGKRGNGLGADGIADFARLMTLTAYPVQGEPYVKDLVLAMRYAVDHGADIVVMAYQLKQVSPEDRAALLEAVRYAETNDVLVVIPTWEAADDMDEEAYCPTRDADTGRPANLLVVSPSDKNGMPSPLSNYGRTQVDLYAPGIHIYAATPGDGYMMGTGTALAAGTVAGVAALVWGYHPDLTAVRLRRLLIDTVTSRRGVELEKSCYANGRMVTDLFLFDELCLSGGIVNAYKAVVAADELNL